MLTNMRIFAGIVAVGATGVSATVDVAKPRTTPLTVGWESKDIMLPGLKSVKQRVEKISTEGAPIRVYDFVELESRDSGAGRSFFDVKVGKAWTPAAGFDGVVFDKPVAARVINKDDSRWVLWPNPAEVTLTVKSTLTKEALAMLHENKITEEDVKLVLNKATTDEQKQARSGADQRIQEAISDAMQGKPAAESEHGKMEGSEEEKSE